MQLKVALPANLRIEIAVSGCENLRLILHFSIFMDSPKTPLLPKHLYSLDIVRGIAALSVVLYHWHMFFDFAPGHFVKTSQPFYAFLKPLYDQGALAVDLFFCLSGFIFFCLYSQKVQKRAISFKDFFALRFSRLYPLHFLTLLFVAAMQFFVKGLYGAYLNYPNNNGRQFILHLFLANNWGFGSGNSFNGPVWSVSVEVLLYLVFFLVCSLNFKRWWQLLCLIGFGNLIVLIAPILNTHGSFATLCGVGRGFISFFAGGIVFSLFSALCRKDPQRKSLKWLFGSLLALWILIPLNHYYQWLPHFFESHFAGIPQPSFHGKKIGVFVAEILSEDTFYSLILFPLTVITFAFSDTGYHHISRRFSVIGNISYSSYLLGFPLVLVFTLLAALLKGDFSFFYTRASLFLFFAVLVSAAYCSYRFFESPMQTWLRAQLIKKPLPPVAPTVSAAQTNLPADAC